MEAVRLDFFLDFCWDILCIIKKRFGVIIDF